MSAVHSIATEKHTGGTASRRQIVLILALLAVAAFFLLYRIDSYPAPWFDEGAHLHVAKNFALHGVYADSSSEGYRSFGPAIGVGPTVLLPIAAIFKVGGVSIPLARLVIVAYAGLAIVALFGLSRHYLTTGLSLLVMAVVFLSPGLEFVYNSRTVLGEIPGLFFLVAALWLWLRAEKPGPVSLVMVGVLFGLACITKNQFALFILPAIFLNWLADLFWYRRRGWRTFVIPGLVAGLMFATWLYIVIVRLGQGDSFSENLTTLRTASAGAFLVLNSVSIERALRFLIDSGAYAAMSIPLAVFGLLLSLPRGSEGQRYGTLMAFVVAGLALYVASLGWPRYAFGPLVLLGIIGGRALALMTGAVGPIRTAASDLLLGKLAAGRALALAGLFGFSVLLILLPVYNLISNVRTQGRDDAYAVADWLNTNVTRDTLIETWEQELAVLTDHHYHYPPQIVLAYSVEQTFQGGQPASERYDFQENGVPEYVVLGPFARYTGIYPEDRLSDYRRVAQIGAYDVYRYQNGTGN